MAEAHGRSGMPPPDFERVESFEPLPGEESEASVWREVRHGLNSMNLLVDQKLGGENESGEVEWITNEVLLVRLSDPNTIRVRWDVGEGPLGRFGPTPGNDVIVGTPDRDILAGGSGDDEIRGLGGRDVLCGNEGNDTIKGGGDGVGDTIHGGPGDDWLGGGDCTSKDVPSASCPSVYEGDAGETTGTNHILGGDGEDDIMGSGTRDRIFAGDSPHVPFRSDAVYGLNGVDFIVGASGADFLDGGPGSDVIEGGDDFDYVWGGDGNYSDRLYASSSNVQVPEFPQRCETSGEFPGASGPAETGGATVFDPYWDSQNHLFGGDGYDILVGSARVDELEGGIRGDDLYGFGGGDYLWGRAGADCLSGGPERDYLQEGDFFGGSSVDPDDSDTLWGGDSEDYLNAQDADNADTLNGGTGTDSGCTVSRGASDPGDVLISCP